MSICEGCGQESDVLEPVGDAEKYEFCQICSSIAAEMRAEVNDLDEILSRQYADGVQALREKYRKKLNNVPDVSADQE
jgi:hypothetical protein